MQEIYPILGNFPTAKLEEIEISPPAAVESQIAPADRFDRSSDQSLGMPATPPTIQLDTAPAAVINAIIQAQFSEALNEYRTQIAEQCLRSERLLGQSIAPTQLLLMWTFDADSFDRGTWITADFRKVVEDARPKIIQMLRALKTGQIQGLALRPRGVGEGDFHLYDYNPSSGRLIITTIDLKTISDRFDEKGTDDWTAKGQSQHVRTQAISNHILGRGIELDPKQRLREYRVDLGMPTTWESDPIRHIAKIDLEPRLYLIHIVALIEPDTSLSESEIEAFLEPEPANDGRYFLIDELDKFHFMQPFAEATKSKGLPDTGLGDFFDEDED